MQAARGIGTPVTMEMVCQNPDLTGDLLDAGAARSFRASVARLNHLAQDRPDLCLAACLLSMRMGKPKTGDVSMLKSILRYLRDRPRLVLAFE